MCVHACVCVCACVCLMHNIVSQPTVMLGVKSTVVHTHTHTYCTNDCPVCVFSLCSLQAATVLYLILKKNWEFFRGQGLVRSHVQVSGARAHAHTHTLHIHIMF